MVKTKLFLSILCCLSSFVSAIGPAYIKGTYLPVRADLKHVSPIMGCMFWEGGVIRKYYDFGYLTDKINKNDWLAQGDGPIRLAHALFNIVEGSFGVSTNLSYPAAHLTAKTVAKIIAQLEKARAQNQPLTVDSIKNIIENDEDFKRSVAVTKATYQQTKDPRFDTQRLSGKSGRSPRVGYRRTTELAQAIVDAFNIEPNIYPPFSVYTILLSFMYRKAVSKQEFLDYFDVLKREFDSTVFVLTESPEIWLGNNFRENELARIKSELQEQVINQNNLEILRDKLYEDAVYGQIIEKFYKGSLPKIAQYKTVTFENKSFADCMETTMRNICNIILYDQQTSTFDLAKVPTANLDPQFAAFYQNIFNKQALNVESQQVHQDWVVVVEAQPWVAYDNMIENGRVQQAPYDANGYIIIPQEVLQGESYKNLERDGNKVKIADRWYITIDGIQQKGYELQPSVRNLIILLNQFFGLNIFEGNLAQEFLRTDFNKTYFPLLAQRVPKLSYPEFDKDTIDSYDYSGQANRINYVDFSLKLSSGHGELKVSYISENLVDLSEILIKRILKDSNILGSYLYVQLFSIYPLTYDKLRDLLVSNVTVFPFIFFLDLFDNYTCTEVLREYLVARLGDKRVDALLEKILKELIQQADLFYMFDALQNIELSLPIVNIISNQIQNDIQQNNLYRATELSTFLVERGHGYQEAIEAAHQATLQTTDMVLTVTGLSLFEKLVEKGQGYQEATNAVGLAVQSQDYGVRTAGFNLLKALFGQDQTYLDALNSAQLSLQSEDTSSFMNSILHLFHLLVENNQEQIYAIAAEVAQKAMQSEDASSLMMNTINLLSSLVEKEQPQIYSLAAEVAQKAMQSDDPVVKIIGLDLLELLVEKGQQGVYQITIESVKKFLQDSDEQVRETGEYVLEKLKEKGIVE